MNFFGEIERSRWVKFSCAILLNTAWDCVVIALNCSVFIFLPFQVVEICQHDVCHAESHSSFISQCASQGVASVFGFYIS